ncbi:MAG: isoprenylcysteine carboxylmethyltransferase family protein [Theionarchaea archaeon]|nr:isoprenylcysteine carboxylmethyltransferase family protein [Theionarchaea archaeon]
MDRAKEHVSGVLFGFTGLGVLIISFLLDICMPLPAKVATPVGIGCICAGMCMVVWAARHLKEAIAGEVEPVLDILVEQGPYQVVRHPVYFGLGVALIGTTILMRSLPGFICVFLLFLPSAVYRAKLEEQALAERFGCEWEAYIRKTGFFLPRL